MRKGLELHVDPAAALGANHSRLIIYALSNVRAAEEPHVLRALDALREMASRLVVLLPGPSSGGKTISLGAVDDVVTFDGRQFRNEMYSSALERELALNDRVDEVVLTGDGWFGPVGTGLATVVRRMAALEVHAWEFVEERGRLDHDFAPQGFPVLERPALWLALRGALVDPANWPNFGSPLTAAGIEAAGYATASAYSGGDLGHSDPALHAVPKLLAAGCPILPSLPFTLYPPFLQRHAIIGSQILVAARDSGFEMTEVLASLCRSVAPKALNTNLALLEVIDVEEREPEHGNHRLAVLAHVTDLDAAEDLFERIRTLPDGYDLYVTTTDGRNAASLRGRLGQADTSGFRKSEVRVTPASRGRDMSDMFIACRDVLLSDEYDIIVKVLARPMGKKTRVVREYSMRYQLDNLLGSKSRTLQILQMFSKEPGLGLVFPPMIHIGYHTMGRAWGPYRPAARRLAERIGVRVPLDEVSPLAPFGGMFYARSSALRMLAECEWTYSDYGHRGDLEYYHLARVQERLLTAAAAERGFHTRTVLTAEHAEISHTDLEFKADQIFSTTSGYPVEQITLLQRAGRTGRGGVVGLSRMYLSLNHPRLARLLLPLMQRAEGVFLYAKAGVHRTSLLARWARARSRDR